jgi:hypothetical protein
LIGVAALAAGFVILGIKLRTETLGYHQNLWGIDWLSYYEAQGRALRSFDLIGWLFAWEGLHPPLSGVVHGLIQATGGGLPVHWAATTAAGFCGAIALGLEGWRRSGPLALLLIVPVFSLCPIQSNYALNASPYPWMLLLLGVSTVLLLRATPTDNRRLWLASALCSALAAQVHVLALAAVGIQTLFLLSQVGAPKTWSPNVRGWCVLVGLSAALIIGVSLNLTRNPWTFHVVQDADDQPWIRTAWHVLESRFGDIGGRLPFAALICAGAVGGLFSNQRRFVLLLWGQALAILAALVFFMETHVADPRLTHYYAAPELLFVAGGAVGLAAFLGRAGTKGTILGLLLALGVAGPAWRSADTWQEARNQALAEAATSPTVQAIAKLYDTAGEGDVLAYLWDHRFLNDEPEHFDAIAAGWPTHRLGRPCFDIESPRMQCNQHEGTRFYFDPRSHSTDFEPLEETLRLVINSAEAPGRARLVVVPGEEAPQRPWPVEAWLTEHGGSLKIFEDPEVLLWTFPVGLVIPSPPPMHPGGEEKATEGPAPNE